MLLQVKAEYISKGKRRANWPVPLSYLFVAVLQMSLWSRVWYFI